MNRFEDCLRKGRLKKVEASAENVTEEMRVALQELERSRVRLSNGAWNESLIQGYFAAYRAARAVLLAQGYRDTNLYGLRAGLDHFLVEPQRLAAEEVQRLNDAKDQKDLVYAGDARASVDEAREMVLWASRFVRQMAVLLALPGIDAERIETTLPAPRNHNQQRG